MKLSELLNLVRWDFKINRGVSWDRIRAKLLLLDIRIEQYIYRNFYRPSHVTSIIWYVCRFWGSINQWFLCNSNIPGTINIGKGLRLPHPQNIILAGFAEIGEFCTIYHNVSVAWNGFKPIRPNAPKIGSRVLIGAGAIIVGDIEIGSDVLIGAGSVIAQSIPDHSRVTSVKAEISIRHSSNNAAEPGSDQHINDPYSIWR